MTHFTISRQFTFLMLTIHDINVIKEMVTFPEIYLTESFWIETPIFAHYLISFVPQIRIRFKMLPFEEI